MGTENNGGSGSCDQPVNPNDVVVDSLPAPPWKTLPVASPVAGADPKLWPALSEAQPSKNNGSIDLDSTKSLPPPEQPKAGGSGPSPATPAQVEQKFHGRGNTKSAHRPYSMHQNKTGPNHAPYNLHPPFPGPSPYQQPVAIQYFHPISPSGYAYPFPPRAFVRPDFQLGESCTGHAPSTSYLPPQNGTYAGGRPIIREQHGQMNHQRPVAYNNFHLPQNIVPRPFMRPQDPSGTTMYYYRPAPPGSVAPYPLNPGVPRPPSPTKALKDRIVIQIEYYFSDKNLQHDQYLKSLMDNQGWVPISIISNFRRVKAMKADIPFIIDALQTSEAIEVKDEKVRKRHDWSKWVSNPTSKSLSPVRNNNNNPNNDETKRDNNEGKLEPPSPSGCSEGHLQIKDLSSDLTTYIKLDDELELEQTTLTNHPSMGRDMEACGVTEEASGVGCAAE